MKRRGPEEEEEGVREKRGYERELRKGIRENRGMRKSGGSRGEARRA